MWQNKAKDDTKSISITERLWNWIAFPAATTTILVRRCAAESCLVHWTDMSLMQAQLQHPNRPVLPLYPATLAFAPTVITYKWPLLWAHIVWGEKRRRCHLGGGRRAEHACGQTSVCVAAEERVAAVWSAIRGCHVEKLGICYSIFRAQPQTNTTQSVALKFYQILQSLPNYNSLTFYNSKFDHLFYSKNICRYSQI